MRMGPVLDHQAGDLAKAMITSDQDSSSIQRAGGDPQVIFGK